MTKKLAIFDWNGTLIDDAPANLLAFNACMRFFEKPEISMQQYQQTMDFPLVHVYARNGVSPDEYLEKFEGADKAYQDSYLPAAKQSPLRAGTIELLDYLLTENYDLMILSNQRIYDLNDQIAERHIHHYFKYISGNEGYDPSHFTRMTKADRFKEFWQAHDYDPAQSFIIGDSLEEPEVAKHFGLMAVAVSWGIISKERLEKANPDIMLDELSELMHYFKNQKSIKVSAQ
jgi:phosphoglycolate phosphatase